MIDFTKYCTEEVEQYEEGSTPPEEEIPYEQIEERPEEIPYEQISSEQPEAEVSEDAAAIKKAVDAAIRAVASDTSLAREGSDEEVMNRLEGEPEPEPEPKPEHEKATKVTVQMYRTEEPRVIGSPPSYRRVESQRAANSKVNFRITSLCIVCAQDSIVLQFFSLNYDFINNCFISIFSPRFRQSGRAPLGF